MAAPHFNFDLDGGDPLGVLTSTARVMREAVHTRLDSEAVERFARVHADAPPPVHREERLHCTELPPQRFLNYLLALEALNFCFWDEEPRWRVAWQGEAHDGYWALAAALRRAIHQDGLPLWDARFLATLETEWAAQLLRGEGRPPPLLEARAANLREVGSVLQERWGGEFANLVEDCGGDAPALALKIAAEFSSFNDECSWRGGTVRFLKRAQICVADLARCLGGHTLGRMTNLHHLTAFADYKVPQVLRGEGILVLAPALAERVERLEELPTGSEEEIEIRAATIWGCEWIVRAVRALGQTGDAVMTSAQVDYLLWSAGQDKTGLPHYHRTRTIFY